MFCSISDLDDIYINPPPFATSTDKLLAHITITCNDALDVQTSTKTFKISVK